MTDPGCHRKHTPIVSKKQKRLFGAVAGGKKTKASGLSQAEAKRHLKESAGKKLPEQRDNHYCPDVRAYLFESWLRQKGI